MEFFIKNGTPRDGPSLCESCSRGFIARGTQNSEILVVCQALYPGRRIHFRVRECSAYADKGDLTLHQMEEVAWSITPRAGKRVGFRPVEESQDDEDVELIL